MLKKLISLLIIFCFLVTNTGFAQVASVELNLASHFSRMGSMLAIQAFRPPHLRYFSYNPADDSFRVLLDKGTRKDITSQELSAMSQELLNYFLIGLTIPNDAFWVNLRPDSADNIIDPLLEDTDVGRILLDADLKLKKDTSLLTSPSTPEGKEYWRRLYQKASELYGTQTTNIPTLTRPWIVPGEIIIRETGNGDQATGYGQRDTGITPSAYIYKATLKVMLEEDYLKSPQPTVNSPQEYSFKDPRAKELNSYSTELIKQLIIPKFH